MDHEPTIAGPRTKSALALIERHRRRGRPRLRLAAPPTRSPKDKMQTSSAQPTAPSIASTISDVSQQFGLTLRAIRLYEEMGLIACGRGPKNSRVLDDQAKARLGVIVDLKRLGLRISEISDLLGPEGPRPAILRRRLEAQLSLLDQQRAGLRAYLAHLPTS